MGRLPASLSHTAGDGFAHSVCAAAPGADPFEPIDDTAIEKIRIEPESMGLPDMPSPQTVVEAMQDAIHGVLDKARWLQLIEKRLGEVHACLRKGEPAKYHHAGTCVYLKTTALDRDLYK
jgi:hypothetical protein